MRALTWHGKRDVRVDTVPDPRSRTRRTRSCEITSTGICGSDLHLYEVLGPFLQRGRHPRPRADGRRRGGRAGRHRAPGGRPRGGALQRLVRHLLHVRPGAALASARRRRCTSRAWAPRCSATPSSTGRCPGGQAEYLRVPFGNTLPIKVPDGPAGRAVRLPLRRAAHRLAGGASTPMSRTAARWSCWASARSATWPRASRSTAGEPRHRRRPGARASGRARGRTASRRSTSRARRATSATPSAS